MPRLPPANPPPPFNTSPQDQSVIVATSSPLPWYRLPQPLFPCAYKPTLTRQGGLRLWAGACLRLELPPDSVTHRLHQLFQREVGYC